MFISIVPTTSKRKRNSIRFILFISIFAFKFLNEFLFSFTTFRWWFMRTLRIVRYCQPWEREQKKNEFVHFYEYTIALNCYKENCERIQYRECCVLLPGFAVSIAKKSRWHLEFIVATKYRIMEYMYWLPSLIDESRKFMASSIWIGNCAIQTYMTQTLWVAFCEFRNANKNELIAIVALNRRNYMVDFRWKCVENAWKRTTKRDAPNWLALMELSIEPLNIHRQHINIHLFAL